MIAISKKGDKVYADSKMYIEIIDNNIVVNGETFGEYDCIGLAKRALFDTAKEMVNNNSSIFNLSNSFFTLTPEEEREVNKVLAEKCKNLK